MLLKNYLFLLKKQLRYTYDYIYQETIANNKYIKERITKLQKEFDAIELRFAKGDISEELFYKHGGNIKEQIKELEQELQGTQIIYRTRNCTLTILQKYQVI